MPSLGEETYPATSFAFFDLFSGIGGMRLGFESAGGTCVFSCERDHFCRETYRANFGDSDIAGDVFELSASEVPDHDVLLAGFPCQPFSLAGVSKRNSLGRPHGFACESQGTLFGEIVRLLRECTPRLFLLENVRNLISHDRGRTFGTMRRILTEDLGYTVSWRLVSSAAWVPQKRERVFILGVLTDSTVTLDDLEVPDPGAGPTLETVLHPEDGTESSEAPYTTGLFGEVSARYTLSNRLWEYLRAHASKHQARGNGFGYGLVDRSMVARTLSARYGKDGSEILVAQDHRNPRRLTPRECARLMGFDSERTSSFAVPVSDTQAYRQFGNSVVAPVVSHIAGHVVGKMNW